MEGIIYQENEWDGVVDAEQDKGLLADITMDEVKKGLKSMQSGKASSQSPPQSKGLKVNIKKMKVNLESGSR